MNFEKVKEILTDEDKNCNISFIRIDGIFYYVSYINTDEKELLCMQTDLIGDEMFNNTFKHISFDELEHRNIALYNAVEIKE